MVRIFGSMMLGAILAQAQVQAQDERIEQGQVPDWAIPSELMPVPEGAGGLIFVRRQDALIHLDAEGQAQYFGYRIRILHPNALQMGNIQTAWNPASGLPVVHFIKVHRDGETIDVLEKSSFEILRREDQQSEEHTSELQSLMRISYAVLCLKKNTKT